MHKKIKFNLTLINLHALFAGVRFFVPVLYIFLRNKNLSYTEISIIAAGFFGGSLILEVPTGIVSDLYGRRIAIVISSTLFTLSFAILGFGNSFWMFFFGALLAGTGEAFISGSDESLIYDSLKQLGREEEFSGYYGKKMATFMISSAVSAICSWVVYKTEPQNVFLFSACFSLFSIAWAILLTEPSECKRVEQADVLRHISEAISFLSRTQKLRWLLVYIVAINMSIEIFFQYLQYFLNDLNLQIKSIGCLYAIFFFITASGAGFAFNLQKRIKKQEVIMTVISVLVLLALSALASIHQVVASVVMIAVIQFSFGFMKPVLNQFVHDQVATSNRATIASLRSLLIGVSIVIVSPMMGLMADSKGYRSMLYVLCLITFTIITLAIIKHHEILRNSCMKISLINK